MTIKFFPNKDRPKITSQGQNNIFFIIITIFILSAICPCANFQSMEQSTLFNSPKLEVTQERKNKPVLIVNLDTKIKIGKKDFDYSQINTTFSTESGNNDLSSKTILGKGLDRFTFKCTAPYMIRWKSDIVPKLPANYVPAQQQSQDPFESRTQEGSFVSWLTLVLPTGGSGWVACEGVAENGTASASKPASVYLYSLDGPNLVETNHLPILLDTRQPHLVPCNANYPNVSPGISSAPYLNGSQIMGEYDPRTGYLVKGHNFRRSFYTCEYENQTISYDFYNPDSPELDALYSPLTVNDTHNFEIGELSDIFCSSANSPIHDIKMINCNSKDECDFFQGCFENNCTLNGVILLEAIPTQKAGIIPKFGGTIRNPHPRGMVYCKSSQNDLTHSFNYLFMGLDRKRYWLSQLSEIPQGAIIQISEFDQIQHTNKSTLFTCETLNFILNSNIIRFAIEFENGTRSLLNSSNHIHIHNSEVDTHPSYTSSAVNRVLVDRVLGYSRLETVVDLTKDMVRIYCFAPSIASPRWVNTSRAIHVRDVEPARILNSRLNETEISYVFNLWDSSRSLFCDVGGEPEPRILWSIPTALVTQFRNANDIMTFKNENETSLHFPLIDELFLGSWKFACTASNEFGSSTVTFDVDIEDGSMSSSAVAGVLAACVLFILLVAVAGVLFYKFISLKRQLGTLQPQDKEMFRLGNHKILVRSVSSDSDQTADSEIW